MSFRLPEPRPSCPLMCTGPLGQDGTSGFAATSTVTLSKGSAVVCGGGEEGGSGTWLWLWLGSRLVATFGPVAVFPSCTATTTTRRAAAPAATALAYRIRSVRSARRRNRTEGGTVTRSRIASRRSCSAVEVRSASSRSPSGSLMAARLLRVFGLAQVGGQGRTAAVQPGLHRSGGYAEAAGGPGDGEGGGGGEH